MAAVGYRAIIARAAARSLVAARQGGHWRVVLGALAAGKAMAAGLDGGRWRQSDHRRGCGLPPSHSLRPVCRRHFGGVSGMPIYLTWIFVKYHKAKGIEYGNQRFTPIQFV